MDRKVFKYPFNKAGLTKFQCPTCGKGLLKVKADTFHYQETKSSTKDHEQDEWEPEWIEYIYSCLLECTNTICKDIVSSSGVGFVFQYDYQDEDGHYKTDYDDNFKPRYFIPHLKLFDIPKGTPQSVKDEINTSFSLIFNDPSSSANHIRIALEHLLTHLKIKRFTQKSGRRIFLTLHKRIELIPAKYDNIKDIFLAIKWLGNAGSHSSNEVRLDDVLDSYELISELLMEIFASNRSRVKSLAKKIIKKKGPK